MVDENNNNIILNNKNLDIKLLPPVPPTHGLMQQQRQVQSSKIKQKYIPDVQKSDSYQRLVGQMRNFINGSGELLPKYVHQRGSSADSGVRT